MSEQPKTENIVAPEGTLAFLTRVMASIPVGGAPGVAQAFMLLQQCKAVLPEMNAETLAAAIGAAEEEELPTPASKLRRVGKVMADG